MKKFSVSPREMVNSFWKNRELISNLVYRDVVGRYKGSFLGVLWSLVTPILMLLVYTFVFSLVFKARWNAESASQSDFALNLFVGLMVFNLFAECITAAPGQVLANVNYVKKVVFPLEILPWVTLGASLFHFIVSFVVWILAYILLIGMPKWTIIFVPVIVAPFSMFIMGVCWTLASLGVYLRDIKQFIGTAVSMLMFLSPVFYPATALPENFRIFMYLNPLTMPIEMMRNVMYSGLSPNLIELTVSSLLAFVLASVGFAFFQKTRKGFADVI